MNKLHVQAIQFNPRRNYANTWIQKFKDKGLLSTLDEQLYMNTEGDKGMLKEGDWLFVSRAGELLRATEESYGSIIRHLDEGLPKDDPQLRCGEWLEVCLGLSAKDQSRERLKRFIEEAIELGQAFELNKDECISIVEYVYGRNRGEIPQEIGGVICTLYALTDATGYSAKHCFENELARVNDIKTLIKVRNKNAAKPPEIRG